MSGIKFVDREANSAVSYLLKRFPVVSIVGPRQCGKTTLCRMVAPDWLFFDLEKESDYLRVKDSPDFFFEKNPQHVIIDEAQELPAIFKALRVAIDSDRKKMGRFMITGSSSPDLVKNISESLAGRVAVIELSTLKSTEICQSKPSKFYSAIEDHLNLKKMEDLKPVLTRDEIFKTWLCGGYPEPILSRSAKDTSLWMENYQKTYLQRDIRKLFPRLKVETFRIFVSMLANLSGSIINYSDLARSLSVSQPTVRNFIEIVHGTFIWRKLEPFTRNAKKRVTKMPKGHVRDSGFRNFLLQIDSLEKLERHPGVGRLWECFIIEEILKGMQNRLISCTPYYYRTQNGAEIDLVLQGSFGLLPIEIKYGTNLDSRNFRGLKDFIEEQKLKAGLVISNHNRVEWIHEKILHLPATHI